MDGSGQVLSTVRVATSTGRPLVNIDVTTIVDRLGGPVRMVPRRVLLDRLLEGFPADRIRCNSRVVGAVSNRYRSGWKAAMVTALVRPCAAPTMPWPLGASPLLAASQSGSSLARKVSHCLLPSCSQSVYMLQAPPAGAATEMPLPASVFIALPAVTQLLTSGPALKASSSTTMCGPPPENATGMSRPIAAEGTISISTPVALAWAVFHRHSPNNATNAARINLIAIWMVASVVSSARTSTSSFDLGQHGALGDGGTRLDRKAGDGAFVVGGGGVLHLQRLEDDDEIASGDLLTLLHGHLDPGALHRGGHRIAGRGRTCVRGALTGLGLLVNDVACAGGSAAADRQVTGERHLESAATDLDDHSLARDGVLFLDRIAAGEGLD